jgi:hypothetical protein
MSFNLQAAFSAGIISGIIATVVQMALWWLFQEPVLETLYRDAGLAAAILMGRIASAGLIELEGNDSGNVHPLSDFHRL